MIFSKAKFFKVRKKLARYAKLTYVCRWPYCCDITRQTREHQPNADFRDFPKISLISCGDEPDVDQSAPKFQRILLVVITPRGFSVQTYFVHFTMAEFASNVLKSTIILKISSFSAEFMGRSLIAVAMNQFSFKKSVTSSQPCFNRLRQTLVASKDKNSKNTTNMIPENSINQCSVDRLMFEILAVSAVCIIMMPKDK